MAKKQGFASLPLPSLPWPSCRLARAAAHSFRELEEGDPKSERSYLASMRSTSAEESGYDDAAEVIIQALRSDRLFFEPAGATSAMLVERASEGLLPFEGSIATVIESHDPYGDFRGSMEAMVAAHGANEWEWLEQMLGWYLTLNRKKTHGVIVLAFLDLLLNLPHSSSTLEIDNGD